MRRTLVCGVDDSPAGRAAARFAAGLQGALGLELMLVHAAEMPAGATGPVGFPQFAGQASEVAAAVLERVAREEGITSFVPRPHGGSPEETIAHVAGRVGPAMIVIGTRGRGPLAAAFTGSVSQSVVTGAACPVALVPAEAPAFAADRPVLCAVDGEPESEAAAEMAADLAGGLGADLVLVHCASPPVEPTTGAAIGYSEVIERGRAVGRELLEQVAAGLHARTPIHLEVETAGPAEGIEAVAERHAPCAIVVGSRGLSGIRAAVMGSVSLQLSRNGRWPVIVVPAREPEAHEPEHRLEAASR